MRSALQKLRIVVFCLGLAAIVAYAAAWQLSRMKAERQRTACAAHLRGIGMAINLYTRDFRGRLPLKMQHVFVSIRRAAASAYDCSISTDANSREGLNVF